MARNLGQYSVVSYVHDLRGERINLGVLVWHPLYGCVFRPPKNFSRIRAIDESVEIARVRSAVDHIKEVAETCSPGDDSPLEHLSLQFRHDLIVTRPVKARMQDPLSTLERLSSTLLPPEPTYQRASSTRQFSNSLVSYFKSELKKWRVSEFQSNFMEEETFKPVPVTASFTVSSETYLWRAFSFASLGDRNKQLMLARSIVAENTLLKRLDKYSEARLIVVAQMPKPQARADWKESLEWLNYQADAVEVEDKQSLEKKIPELLPPSLTPALTT